MEYSDQERKQIRDDFYAWTNMAPGELDEWLKTEPSQSVGDKSHGDESTGHASGRRIIALKRMKNHEFGDDDYDHMRKVINYVKRHTAQRPSSDVEHTRWRYSLMNWGYDPIKEDHMKKYDKPELRERLKKEIQNSDKGGRPGQWSARKAQLLAQEYKNEGGGYIGGKDNRAKHLDKWTEQEWQTKEGAGEAETDKGMKRYLPKRAWELLSDDQRKQTDSRKRKSVRQYIPNTPAARAARAYVDHKDATLLGEDQLHRLSRNELESLARSYDIRGRSHLRKDQLAHVLHTGFSRANTGMKKGELRKRAEEVGVNASQKKERLIHDIVSASRKVL